MVRTRRPLSPKEGTGLLAFKSPVPFFGLVLLAALPVTALADGKYSIKTVKAEVPKQIAEPIRKLLGNDAVQLLDDKGQVLCEVWFRGEVPAKAESQKGALTYHDLEETIVLGAIRFPKTFTDYRKQKVKPGAYTLRLAFQPMDGDHMGTAPFGEFCLISRASDDRKPDTMTAKELQEMSAKAIGESHPGVLLLFPNPKPEAQPKLVDKGEGNWVVSTKEDANVSGQKMPLGISLTLVGQTTAP
jgi:hypothetical protein